MFSPCIVRLRYALPDVVRLCDYRSGLVRLVEEGYHPFRYL